jgi:stage II sporulation protein D (peptidoglycan lytic transglycosylase)
MLTFHRLAVPALVAAALLVLAGPAVAAGPESVTLVPAPGTEFSVGGRTYAGELTVTGSSSGLALTEATSVDAYLAGIKEVPFSWPEEALAAQAVAARTYLANTLRNGRSARGREYGFDICASSACQVYAGIGFLDEPGGDRWLDAVKRTAGEILTFDGAPILAVYSSSTGSRTMAVQDVWGGPALFYLQPVDSPEDGVSPFASWEVELPSAALVEILAAAGYAVGGDLLQLEHDVPAEGEGIATVRIVTTGGSASVSGTDMKGAMNRWGPELFPGMLPSPRTDGKRLPQALPSYSYDVSYLSADEIPPLVLAYLPQDDVIRVGTVRFIGEGWGHNLGMSQYGALAMAQQGASYQEILAHYYGGLTPEDGADQLPDQVVIGLGWDLDGLTIDASGPFDVAAGEDLDGPRSGGTWSLIQADGAVVLFPSIDYPTSPDPGRHVTWV